MSSKSFWFCQSSLELEDSTYAPKRTLHNKHFERVAHDPPVAPNPCSARLGEWHLPLGNPGLVIDSWSLDAEEVVWFVLRSASSQNQRFRLKRSVGSGTVLGMGQTPLEKARARQAEMAALGIKPERLSPLEKAAKSPRSAALAIRAKCYDCQGQDCDPGWRDRVANCPITKCPLYPLRPYRDKAKGTEDED